MKKKKIQITSFEDLRNEKDIQMYLQKVLDTGSPAFFLDALRIVIHARSMMELAKESGVSVDRLYKTLSAKKPDFRTLQCMAKASKIKLPLTLAIAAR